MIKKRKYNVSKLLAPGGDLLCIKAAIDAGADEIYFGLDSFNARRRAVNLTIKDLLEISLLAKEYGIALYLTLNTLITESELKEITKIISEGLKYGLDALIIQDLGLIYHIRQHFPDCIIHASTQLTTHNHGQIDFLKQCGVSRVNLSRELSLENITELTRYAHECGIETEVFVHGAYCISFSGQCYMSSFMGGQSGNRGLCFQPCRRKYSYENGKQGFPLSLKDNSAFKYAKQLVDAGVDSLKIEGRIKGFHYVHNVVSAWRRQLNAIAQGRPALADDPELHKVYNREFHAGYLENSVSKDMFSKNPVDSSLKAVGKVASYYADRALLNLQKGGAVLSGQQILIYTKDNRFICSGTVGTQISQDVFEFTIEHELKGKILAGQGVFSSGKKEIKDNLENVLTKIVVHEQALSVILSGELGNFLSAKWSCGDKVFTTMSASRLEIAQSSGLHYDTAWRQFSKLKGTSLVLRELQMEAVAENLFIPLKELNQLRREAVEYLLYKPVRYIDDFTLSLSAKNRSLPSSQSCDTHYLVIVNSLDTFKTINDTFTHVQIAYEVSDPHTFPLELDVIPYFPSIIDEENITAFYQLLEMCNNRNMVILNNSALIVEAERLELEWVAGPLLNTTNSMSVKSFTESYYNRGAFLSNELNKNQLEDVCFNQMQNIWMTIFGPILLMQSRQCLRQPAVDCSKPVMDDSCFYSCDRSCELKNNEGDKFHLIKRPFFHTEIYNQAYLCVENALDDFIEQGLNFCIDLRDLPGLQFSLDEKCAILTSIVTKKRGDITVKRTLSKIRSKNIQTTLGNYNRGLS